MCIIVDTNTFGPVFDSGNEKHAEFKPVFDWVLYGKGKFVIGGSKYMGELRKAQKYLRIFGVLNIYRNKVIQLDTAEVDKIQKSIEAMVSDSDFDDPHLPAMVIVSKCRLICSDDSRSVRFVTNPHLYPDKVKTPKYYTGSRNCDLLSDKYIDARYRPLEKMPQNMADQIETKINSCLSKQRKT